MIVNAERLVERLVQAFENWARDDINGAWWDDQFREMSKWDYDGITRRKNGETVGWPRDIYDLGTLYKSGIESYNFDASRTVAVASWRWDAKNSTGNYYARYVHDGLGTNLTARPWTDELYYPQKFSGSIPEKALMRQIKAAFGSK